MIIKRMVVDNFTSFYGKHRIQLDRGLNVILGPAGSGKTNLARAFAFAVLGHTDIFLGYRGIPRSRLINSRHGRKSKAPLCHVKVEVEHEGKEYVGQNTLSLDEGKMKQSLIVDSVIDEIITSRTFKHVYLDPIILEEYEERHKNLSHGVRMTQQIIKHLNLNLKAGIRMAILDGPDMHLALDHRGKLLKLILELPMEQVILMRSLFTRELETHPSKIHHVKFDWENDSSKFIE